MATLIGPDGPLLWLAALLLVLSLGLAGALLAAVRSEGFASRPSTFHRRASRQLR